jgi:formate-dependent nitrite reductase membrane component NrfD
MSSPDSRVRFIISSNVSTTYLDWFLVLPFCSAMASTIMVLVRVFGTSSLLFLRAFSVLGQVTIIHHIRCDPFSLISEAITVRKLDHLCPA